MILLYLTIAFAGNTVQKLFPARFKYRYCCVSVIMRPSGSHNATRGLLHGWGSVARNWFWRCCLGMRWLGGYLCMMFSISVQNKYAMMCKSFLCRMSTYNLAAVFAPNLLRLEVNLFAADKQEKYRLCLTKQAEFVQVLINNCDRIGWLLRNTLYTRTSALVVFVNYVTISSAFAKWHKIT